jgi:hypothetical protein
MPLRMSSIILVITASIIVVVGLQKMSINSKRLAVFSIYAIVAMTLLDKAMNNKLIANFPVSLLSGMTIQHGGFSNDLLHGYSWLGENAIKESVVLFGNHYEVKDGGYIRSVLSGTQMYCESAGGKYKGVCMEEDYSFRHASSVYFYKTFVRSSKISNKLLEQHYDKDYQFGEKTYFTRSLAQEKERSIKGKALYYLSFGKNWSWINIPAKINREIKAYWDEYDKMNEKEATLWAQKFIKSQGINYIVLENGDRPTSLLLKLTDKVYENSKVIILRVKDNLL